MMSPTIIVVTYNRPNSLRRLLNSLKNANYPIGEIGIVISIDFQDSPGHSEVVKMANEFVWEYGPKEIFHYEENLGLRKHVLTCGNLVSKYSSIIMLEDDLYVSPQFYLYAQNALTFYGEDDNICGISLYRHEKNPSNDRLFQPIHSPYEIFFLQFAQSWGQCWTRKMWLDFYNWYNHNNEWQKNDINLPAFVLGWPSSSWLKYFIKYTSETNKYFVYPYYSLTTNFHDSGTHNKHGRNNTCQVQLEINSSSIFRFPHLKDGVKYDAYFEIEEMDKYIKHLNLPESSSLCIDLYGTKNNFDKKRYWLSIQNLPFKVVKQYGLNVRPHELNIILDNEGDDIFLYDTDFAVQIDKRKSNRERIVNYDYNISITNLLALLKVKLLKKFI